MAGAVLEALGPSCVGDDGPADVVDLLGADARADGGCAGRLGHADDVEDARELAFGVLSDAEGPRHVGAIALEGGAEVDDDGVAAVDASGHRGGGGAWPSSPRRPRSSRTRCSRRRPVAWRCRARARSAPPMTPWSMSGSTSKSARRRWPPPVPYGRSRRRPCALSAPRSRSRWPRGASAPRSSAQARWALHVTWSGFQPDAPVRRVRAARAALRCSVTGPITI